MYMIIVIISMIVCVYVKFFLVEYKLYMYAMLWLIKLFLLLYGIFLYTSFRLFITP